MVTLSPRQSLGYVPCLLFLFTKAVGAAEGVALTRQCVVSYMALPYFQQSSVSHYCVMTVEGRGGKWGHCE